MNFQDLYKKIRAIDENTEVPAVIEPMPAVDTSGAVDASVGECGMMPPMGAMSSSAPPPQQDTVSMNVSMNAQGAGGIRDLMNVLKDIQDGPDHGPENALTGEPHHAEIDADPELDIAMPMSHGDDEADVQVVHVGNDDELEKEAFVNEPDEEYQDQEYMNNTLSVNKQKMTKGNSPNADNVLTMAAILPVAAGMVRENLKSRLQDHYNNIKEDAKHVMMRSGPGARMTRYDKTDPDPAHQKHRKDTADAIKKHRATGKDLEVDGLDQKVGDKTLYRYDTKRVEKQ